MEKPCSMLDFSPVEKSLDMIKLEIGIVLGCLSSLKESLEGFGNISREERDSLAKMVLPIQSQISSIRSKMYEAFDIVVSMKNGG
ncbi:MAG: hypothetical protein ABH889_01640 [Candidatus Portnoybacteria bacterium]